MSLLYILDLAGTFAFAVSGALMGAGKRMDIYGVFILALVAGVGGGTLRDIMLGRTPPFVFRDAAYLAAALFASLLVFFLYKRVLENMKLLNAADAVGLGVFTCIGAAAADGAGCSWYGVALFGVMTATVGGMIRDVLAGEVPFVLQKEVYASASAAGCLLFIFLRRIDVNMDVSVLITSVFVTAVRMASLRGGWNLPKIFIR